MKIKVRVAPRAKRESVEPYEDGLKVYLKAPALEGKANKRLIEMLSEHFKVKKYNISIIKGLSTREKIIEIIQSS